MSLEILIVVFTVFGVIGFASVISFLFLLLSTFGKNVSNISINEKIPSPESERFLSNIATISGGALHHFNVEKCQTFLTNQAYFQSLLKDVVGATETISIVTYVWGYDDVSEEFFTELKKAVKRGVTVRLLIDAYGNSMKQGVIDDLNKAGISAILFRPFTLGKLSLYYARVHRRAYIFDGKIGYFGGAAISKRWFKDELDDDFAYKDVMYRVVGDTVATIAGAFGELWSTYSNNLAQDLYCVDEVGLLEERKNNAFSLTHIPRNDVHPLTSVFWYSCMSAKETIMLISPYFIPGKALSEILCQKAKAGVKIKIITQGTSEIWFVQEAARSYYKMLLEAGIEIYEHTEKHMHAKVLVIDDFFTVCGSANFDIRSQRVNHEFIVGVQSKEFAGQNLQLVKNYEPYLKKIELEEWEKRPLYKKFIENIAHSLSEQF